MTEAEVVRITHAYFASLFPRTCENCGRSYATLREWVAETKPLPGPISYEAETRDWRPVQPVGTLVFANCPCGTTLALTTDRMETAQRHAILDWIRDETLRRGIAASELLEELRQKVREAVLGEPG